MSRDVDVSAIPAELLAFAALMEEVRERGAELARAVLDAYQSTPPAELFEGRTVTIDSLEDLHAAGWLSSVDALHDLAEFLFVEPVDVETRLAHLTAVASGFAALADQ